MEMRNLWPESLALEEDNSPKAILKYQAGQLAKLTGNRLYGTVETKALPDNRMLHELFIVAPSLSNYRYELLTAHHPIAPMYPVHVHCDVLSDAPAKASNEEEFVAILERILRHERILEVVRSLLLQAS